MKLKVSGLEFSYEQKKVLSDLSFEVKEGEFVSILGASGGGKSTVLNLLAGLLHVIATLFLLHRRRAVQFSISAIMWFISLLPFYVLSICLQSAPTGYAAEHPIPKGLACHTPMAEHADMEKAVNPEDSTTYLQIRKGIQGGIYEYSFFYPQLPEGTIWLQCYEAGKNVPLSKREIKKKTSQKTEGTDRFTCLAENKEFTIYEGDWSEYYAARIEVWFKDKKGNKRKLLEKFYTVGLEPMKGTALRGKNKRAASL